MMNIRIFQILRRRHSPREHSNHGMTLTELIVAAILVTIIFAGALAVEYTVRQSRNTASKDTLLAMATSATMLQIVRDTTLATGNADSPGLTDIADGFCVRRDLNNPATPLDDTDNNWICYSQRTQNIHRCTKIAGAAASACLAADPIIGTAVPLTAGGNPGLDHLITIDENQGIYLEVSLTNRTDPLTPADTFDNPELTLTTHVYPLEHGY